MKNNFIFNGIVAMALSSMTLQGAWAQQNMMQQGAPIQVNCKDASLMKNGELMTAEMNIDLRGLKVKSNQAAVFTPMIVNGTDTLRLPAVGVYGRTRWYQFERMGINPISGSDETAMRYTERPSSVNYAETVAYKEWMNGSELILQRQDYGCCAAPQALSELSPLAMYKSVVYEPTFRFQAAVAEAVKTREISGRAYVDFPVNQTVIYPDYRRNSTELAKIIATIDSVRNDKDITVKSLSIKGYASPEGSYSNNTRLAKGRTEALKQYVQNLYNFDYGFIKTDYEPEDWEGLREYVASSAIEVKDALLALIDSNMEPDAKNSKIQSTYPDLYNFLLTTVYPGLRHSDYRIEYTIRGFSDAAEIAEVMRTQPSKLSLNEMYILAGTLEPGSAVYNEVMETAVRMYPTDETAILNAATAAMQRNDLEMAERYLMRAGNNGEALYARGVLAGLQKDFGKAIKFMEQAASMGNDGAKSEMELLKEAQKYAR